jgi:prepilin-type N-terminal cleavage/methylation domain-containing protein
MKKQTNQAFTLIEVILALSIFAIVSSGLYLHFVTAF